MSWLKQRFPKSTPFPKTWGGFTNLISAVVRSNFALSICVFPSSTANALANKCLIRINHKNIGESSPKVRVNYGTV